MKQRFFRSFPIRVLTARSLIVAWAAVSVLACSDSEAPASSTNADANAGGEGGRGKETDADGANDSDDADDTDAPPTSPGGMNGGGESPAPNIGGQGGSGGTNAAPDADASVPEVALSPDMWTDVEALTVARSELSAAVLEDRIYLAGGFGDMTRFDAYLPESDEWVNLKELPEGRDHASIVAHDGLVYIFGGSGTKTAWSYDPVANEFTDLPDMPFQRSSAVAVSLGEYIYVVAGAGPAPTVLLRYEPVEQEWDTLAEISRLRDHSAAVVLGGKIWSLGGRENSDLFHDSVEVYDPERNEWESGPPMLSVRSGFGVVAWREHLIACGGEVRIDGVEQALSSCEALPPSATQWEEWPALPQGTHGIAIANYQDRVFILGGSTQFFSATNTDRAYELLFVPSAR
jgi:N-acetylneuraminic acid mutarotase